MTVLVTGAAGFIGHAVTKALLMRGDHVIGIDNCNSYYNPMVKHGRLADIAGLQTGRFKFHLCDFADQEALDSALGDAEIESIVHLGAQAGVGYSIKDPRAYVQSNLVGHVNMLEIARHRGIAHFVYASSSSVYGNAPRLPLSVDDRVDHPVSLYAATKKADELMSETYAHLFRLPSTGLRFFTVYGPWGRPDMALWKFTQKILRGEPIEVNNNGEMRRDFTHIDDIVAGLMAVLDHPPADDNMRKPGGSVSPHTIYNVGNNRSEPLGRMIDLIEQACGRKAERIMRPMPPGEVVETYADIDAIANDLGYSPTIDIDNGIPQFVAWYRNWSGD